MQHERFVAEWSPVRFLQQKTNVNLFPRRGAKSWSRCPQAAVTASRRLKMKRLDSIKGVLSDGLALSA
jgi:hypothetical protein